MKLVVFLHHNRRSCGATYIAFHNLNTSPYTPRRKKGRNAVRGSIIAIVAVRGKADHAYIPSVVCPCEITVRLGSSVSVSRVVMLTVIRSVS